MLFASHPYTSCFGIPSPYINQAVILNGCLVYLALPTLDIVENSFDLVLLLLLAH
jgi:hypothetical protein